MATSLLGCLLGAFGWTLPCPFTACSPAGRRGEGDLLPPTPISYVCARGRSLSHALSRCFSLSRARLHSQRVAKRNVLLMKKKLRRPALCARRERERKREREREKRERDYREPPSPYGERVHVCMYVCDLCLQVSSPHPPSTRRNANTPRRTECF